MYTNLCSSPKNPLRPRDPNINSWPAPISSRLGLPAHYQPAKSLLRGDFGRNAWDAPWQSVGRRMSWIQLRLKVIGSARSSLLKLIQTVHTWYSPFLSWQALKYIWNWDSKWQQRCLLDVLTARLCHAMLYYVCTAVLCCAMLCYAVLCCAVLCQAILCCALLEVMHRQLDQPSDEVIHRQRSQPVIARVAKENLKHTSFYNEISNNEMSPQNNIFILWSP